MPTYRDPLYAPITTEELITSQLHDAFSSETLLRFEQGLQLPFLTNYNGLFFRAVQDPPQIVVPQNLTKKVLHPNHHIVLEGHSGGQKLYHRIRKH